MSVMRIMYASVSNRSKEEGKAEVTVQFLPEGGRPQSVKRLFGVRPRREDSILVPFDMSEFPKRAGRIEVNVKSGDQDIGSRKIRVRDSKAGLKGIEFVYLTYKDVVRHRLVQDIINAYERHEKRRRKG